MAFVHPDSVFLDEMQVLEEEEDSTSDIKHINIRFLVSKVNCFLKHFNKNQCYIDKKHFNKIDVLLDLLIELCSKHVYFDSLPKSDKVSVKTPDEKEAALSLCLFQEQDFRFSGKSKTVTDGESSSRS